MLIKGSRGFVIDNSGALTVEVIGHLGGSKVGYLGETVRISIKKAIPNSKVSAGETYHAIIAGTKYKTQRPNGTFFKSNSNYFILLDKTSCELLGTSVDSKMYVAREVITKNNHIKKLVSACKGVF